MQIFRGILRFGLGWSIAQAFLVGGYWTEVCLTLVIIYIMTLSEEN